MRSNIHRNMENKKLARILELAMTAPNSPELRELLHEVETEK